MTDSGTLSMGMPGKGMSDVLHAFIAKVWVDTSLCWLFCLTIEGEAVHI
jgi:hypothetical protein